ncbi:DgyrCDS6803 [Dimorphilus gyrociliatus]|uniref:DgyrCDS6803 n=1 Tax=Dimorphilus gyrociliatus TaxID=2664684 RepID=A0A7I8VTY1_9ANNE|nr:DgyrCDS6803 [Dimorphilus gyrociliatus]
MIDEEKKDRCEKNCIMLYEKKFRKNIKCPKIKEFLAICEEYGTGCVQRLSKYIKNQCPSSATKTTIPTWSLPSDTVTKPEISTASTSPSLAYSSQFFFQTSTPYAKATATATGTELDKTTATTVTQSDSIHESTKEPEKPLWEIRLESAKSIKLKERWLSIEYVNVSIWVDRNQLCQGCQVYIEIIYKNLDNFSCNSVKVDQVAFGYNRFSINENFCRISVSEDKFTSGHWMSREIAVYPRIDGTLDGLRKGQIEIGLRTKKENGPSVFVDVSVENGDVSGICRSVNDPHILTFDGLQYNNYNEGEFVLYSHTSLPFKIHAVYQRCSKTITATCNCAVLIQSADDVISIDRCSRLSENPVLLHNHTIVYETASVLTAKIYLRDNFTKETYIRSSMFGKRFEVYLPNGVTVNVEAFSEEFLNVWIIPGGYDFNNTRGLCGYLDNDVENDLKLRDESYLKSNTANNLEKFINNWRVDIQSKHSLMNGYVLNEIASLAKMNLDLETFCLCSKENKCSESLSVHHCFDKDLKDITDSLLANAVIVNYKKYYRLKRHISSNQSGRSNLIINQDYKPKKGKDWPKNSRISRKEARKICEDELANSAQAKICNNLDGFSTHNELENCIEDIRVSQSKDWLIDATNSANYKCKKIIERNASSSENLKNMVKMMCQNSCSGNGNCTGGVCACNQGYKGTDCSIKINDIPVLQKIFNNGLCDSLTQNCTSTIIYGKRFDPYSNFTCLFTPYTKMNNKITQTDGVAYTKVGTLRNFNSIECPVPTNCINCVISITNGGQRSNTSLLYTIYNGSCQRCYSRPLLCEIQQNACAIKSQDENEKYNCHASGDSPHYDNCLVCNPLKAKHGWTRSDSLLCVKLPDWAIAVLAASVGALLGVICGVLIYKCCFKSCRKKSCSDNNETSISNSFSGVLNVQGNSLIGANLHRSPPNYFNGFTFRPNFDQPEFDGEFLGVENGIRGDTYF